MSEFETGAGTYYGEDDPPVLAPGERLYANQYVESRDGRYRLVYQNDSNLVLYGPGGPVWASGSSGYSPGRLEMQVDGNLVIYDSGGEPVWATNADGAFGAYLSVHNSGCVTVEREPYDVIWSKCD